jgi:hypothetical protein
MPTRAVPIILVSLHLVACASFFVLRQPGIKFLAERERARREAGRFFIVSGGPYTFIAERPLYDWSEWHGGEETWVKFLEVANLPSIVLTATVGGIVIAAYRFTGYGDFSSDTWFRAYIFLFFSVAQWWLVGRGLEKAGRRVAHFWNRDDG